MSDSVRDDENFEGEVATEPEAQGEVVPEVEGGEGEVAPEGASVGSDADELRSKLAEMEDKHLRLVAEFTNYRRRTEQERLSTWGRAQADLITKFLEVRDDLQRVSELDLSNATVEAIMEGIDLVEKKFGRLLEDAGVETIDPVGQPFDPEKMEAIMRVPAESPEQDDTIAQVMQRGYALNGVLMRPARVAVYKTQ